MAQDLDEFKKIPQDTNDSEDISEPTIDAVALEGMSDLLGGDEDESVITIPSKETLSRSDPGAYSRNNRQFSVAFDETTISNRSLAGREIREATRDESWDVEQEDRIAVSIFRTALKEQRILEGTIAGVESNNDGAYWVAYYGPITVRIPFNSSFMMIPAELAVTHPSAEIVRRQHQLLNKATGATINYTISSLIPAGNGTFLAIGSRTNALSKIRKSYFGSRTDHPVKAGDRFLAQVLTNGEHAAYLTFCGVDVKVKKRELSHKYIQDITESFYIGQKIPVQVMSIDTNKGLPQLTVSRKPIEMEQFRRNVTRIHRNGTYLGTVTSIRKREDTDGSSITISLFLDQVDVPAFAKTNLLSLGNNIRQGDKVSFQANGTTEEGYVHGRILELIKTRYG